MIKRHYSADSRLALNVIWNAAGRYDFDPDFLAFYTNGQPDFYFNIIIGLAEKWLDMRRISAFFDSFSYARESDEYSEYVWLGLESSLYQREAPLRPVLNALRRQHAEAFFKVQQQLSKQQMEVMSMDVYTQQQARWAEVTGRRLPGMSTKEKAMCEALKLGGELDTEEIISKLKAFLSEYCRFEFDEDAYKRRHHPGIIRRLWGRHVHAQYKNCDHLIVRSGTGTGDPRDAVHLNQLTGFKQDEDKAVRDRAYIEGCFGRCIYADEKLKEIESMLCTNEDADCRLWFTDGGASQPRDKALTDKAVLAGEPDKVASAGDPDKASGTAETENAAAAGRIGDTSLDSVSVNAAGADNKLPKLSSRDAADVLNVHRSTLEQRSRNIKYYERNSLQIRESIKKLSSELEVLMSSFLKRLPERADAGRIDAGRAYRTALFNDTRIFLRDGDEAENNIRVDILLDASQSRMNSQELIASEAYVLAESIMKAGVPVQVLAFRSLRGYTVIDRLKSFSDKNALGAFRYFASGWNRDALAIKAAGYMIEDELKANGSDRHILLILTDASPNDSTPLAPCGARSKAQNYEGLLSVEAAETAVRELKSRHIHTAAVFHGSSIHLENAYRIYGKEYIRIRSIAQLASGFIDLMQSALQEMEAD